MRDYRSVAVCFTLANQVTEDGLLSVFRSHPGLLHTVKTKVVRRTFRSHVLAYAKAWRQLYDESAKQGKPVFKNVDGELVQWYHKKLMMLRKFYESEDALLKIVKIQHFVRGYLGKIRFRNVCDLLAKDPKVMHHQIMQILRRIDTKVGSAGLNYAAASPKAASPQNATALLPLPGLKPTAAFPASPPLPSSLPASPATPQSQNAISQATIQHCREQIQTLEASIASSQKSIEQCKQLMKVAEQDF